MLEIITNHPGEGSQRNAGLSELFSDGSRATVNGNKHRKTGKFDDFDFSPPDIFDKLAAQEIINGKKWVRSSEERTKISEMAEKYFECQKGKCSTEESVSVALEARLNGDE